MSRPRIEVVFVGPPCSGKGTVGARLTSDLGINFLSPGLLYREAMASGSEFGQLVHEYLKAGGYCPDEMTNDLMDQVTRDAFEAGRKIGYDGYPRRVAQMEHILAHYDVGVWLMMDASYEARAKASDNRGRWDDGKLFSKREETFLRETGEMIKQVAALPNAHKFNTLEHVNTTEEIIEFVREKIGK